jgi:hypothetical protein
MNVNKWPAHSRYRKIRKEVFCMKRKTIATLAVAAVLAGSMFIPPVQAAAESALSVFRVSDAKTITISVTDIQDMVNYAKQLKSGVSGDKSTGETGSKGSVSPRKTAESILNPLADPKDFTAFPFSLPRNNQETPKLYSIASGSKTFTLNTAEINAELAKLQANPISSSLNGTKITVNTSPAAVAEYSNFTLIETQGVHVDAPSNTVNTLWNEFTGQPMIPADLKSQLVAIDPTGSDVYLPVIEGLGRGTDLGMTTGYIYSAKDLAQVTAIIPGLATSSELTKLQGENASALIWIRDGVLYALAGNQSDSELSQIARNIR